MPMARVIFMCVNAPSMMYIGILERHLLLSGGLYLRSQWIFQTDFCQVNKDLNELTLFLLQ